MSKAQFGVPLLLLVVLGLLILYILWVNPSERAKILGLDDSVKTQPNTTSSEDKTVFTKTIGYVGRKTGSAIKTHTFDDLKLEYPLVDEVVISKSTAVLTANVLLKGSTRVSIPGDYSQVVVNARIGGVVGTPNLEIKSGNVLIYKSQIAKNQNINLVIDAAKITGDSLEVSCQWKGLLFWESQKCELLDFEVVKQGYSSINPSETHDLTLTSAEGEGENFKLCFTVAESDNSAPLNILLNSVPVYSASPSNRSAPYCVRESLSTVDLSTGENLVVFSADPGGAYGLEDVSLIVFEKSLEASNQTFYFSIPGSIYDKASKYVLSLDVEEIIDVGGLDVVVGNVYYYLSPADIVEGVNLIDISIDEMLEGTNKMRVESSTGRFKIGDLKLLWE